MLYEVVKLRNYYNLDNNPTLEVFCPFCFDTKGFHKRKGILVLPGGGYAFCSNREGEPVALEFLTKDYVAFVLTYTANWSNNAHYPTQLLEVMAAMDYIRKNAERFNLESDKIIVAGFSAGGHLAASYGYMYKNEELNKIIDVEAKNVKPNGILLGYPVITMKDGTHEGTRDYLTEKKPELIELLSVEDHIDKDYPMTFVWCTEDDGCVPSLNTKLLDKALNNANVIHKTIIYPHGYHGLSLAKKVVGIYGEFSPEIVNWPNEADEFFCKNLDE